MGISLEYHPDLWITFRKDNHVIFYMRIDENGALIFQDYSTEKEYDVNNETLEGIKDKIKKII